MRSLFARSYREYAPNISRRDSACAKKRAHAPRAAVSLKIIKIKFPSPSRRGRILEIDAFRQEILVLSFKLALVKYARNQH